MKALVTTGSTVEVVDQPDPSPGAGQVVIAVDSCGICGSDVHIVESGHAGEGRVLGHEFSGTIVAMGRDVSGLAEGQAVAVNPIGSCGSCDACRRGFPFLCETRPNIGLSAPGGFAEYAVASADQVFAIRQGVRTELGARAEPLAVAIRGVDLADLAPDDDALVFGVGPIGLNVILALRASSHSGRIVAVGRSHGRRAAAAAAGADVVLDSREMGPAEYAAREGISFGALFECSAYVNVVAECMPCLGVGATIVELALPSQPAQVDLRAFVGKGIRLAGSCALSGNEFQRSLELITTGKADVGSLVSERVGLAGAPSAFQRLQHPNELVAVLVQPKL